MVLESKPKRAPCLVSCCLLLSLVATLTPAALSAAVEPQQCVVYYRNTTQLEMQCPYLILTKKALTSAVVANAANVTLPGYASVLTEGRLVFSVEEVNDNLNRKAFDGNVKLTVDMALTGVNKTTKKSKTISRTFNITLTTKAPTAVRTLLPGDSDVGPGFIARGITITISASEAVAVNVYGFLTYNKLRYQQDTTALSATMKKVEADSDCVKQQVPLDPSTEGSRRLLQASGSSIKVCSGEGPGVDGKRSAASGSLYTPALHAKFKRAAMFASTVRCKWSNASNWQCSNCFSLGSNGFYVGGFQGGPVDDAFLVAVDSVLQGVVVVFRSTYNSVSQWMDNIFNSLAMGTLTVEGKDLGRAHSGFLAAFQAFIPHFDELLAKALAGSQYKDVYLVGHSRGGSLADLAAAYTHASAAKFGLASPSSQVHLLTMGAPRTGDCAFASYLESSITERMRAAWQFDPVPTVPLDIQGFCRWNPMVWAYKFTWSLAFWQPIMLSDNPTFYECANARSYNIFGGACAQYTLLPALNAFDHKWYYDQDMELEQCRLNGRVAQVLGGHTWPTIKDI